MSKNNEFIFHIISGEDWQMIKNESEYAPFSLGSEGFIHFSYQSQLKSVADRFYSGIKNLLVLKIRVKKLVNALKIEKVGDEGEFPHLYGKLNLDSVEGVYPLEKILEN
jgi:uncharacterized protein (DUF952 family)